MEKLSPGLDHVKVIVAHEFGHAAHNLISNNAGIDWTQIHWESPLVWLFQEGAAIHFSRKTAGGLHPSIYFSYDEQGQDWLAFAESNRAEIKKAFAKNYCTVPSNSLYREWFSINGGKTFGYSRLAYFLGDWFMQVQMQQLGEMNAVTLWKDSDFEAQVKQWLFQ
ncbi:hypothetical protein ACFQI7_01380 [Paenibacillus allorhizosphaerae]|uniref:hypothetical protein n=1 Tax=Paenibacillus allorhizosphaerae TaxID=2849866 RepID=UPI001C406A7D|nr:hypothetical protein [Paenibacillus allorhizosphaerae]